MSSGKRSDESAEHRTPRLALYLITLILLIPGLVGCKSSSGYNKTPSVAIASIKEPPSLYRFVSGERLVYKLDYTSKSTSDFGVLFSDKKASDASDTAQPMGMAQSFDTAVRSELVVTVVDKRADSVLIAYSLRNTAVRLIANQQEAVSEAEAIKKGLSQDIFAVVNYQGRVLSVRFDPAASELTQSFARALIAATQIVLPGAKASDLRQWETQEDDPLGQYIARHQAEPGSKKADSQSDLITLRKTKVRYLQSRQQKSPDEMELSSTITPKGETRASFDAKEGHLVSLNGRESQAIEISGKTVARAENSVEMSYIGKQSLTSAELSALRAQSVARENQAAAIPLSATPSKEEGEAAIHRTALEGATLESLLDELASRGESAEADSSLYLKFKALVYLKPETSAALGRVLATADAKSATMSILTGALSSISHMEAQAALVSAIRARTEDWPALSMLIPALAAAGSPTESSEETLRELAFNSQSQEIASTAQLALGSIARTLADGSPERASKIVELFIKQMGSSQSEDMMIQTLLVLGNSGSIQAFETISRYLTNPSAQLRAAATAALRWIQTDKVDGLLIKALSSDKEARVRLEAAFALGFREMTAASFKAQKRAFQSDRDEKVRLAALSNLWKEHKAFPEMKRIVKQTAANDRSKEVRKAAAEIMDLYPKGYFDK